MASQASARPNCRAAFISRGITSIRCLAITLVLTLDGVSPWQAPVDPPVTRQEIARAIGTDADAGAVLKLVIAHAMAQSHREFFLASQIPDDWLPRLAGVEFVRLGQAEAVKHLAACGEYSVVERVRRTGDTVSLQLSHRCGASWREYVASFDGHGWILAPAGTDANHGWRPGIGSGYARAPAGCLCLGGF